MENVIERLKAAAMLADMEKTHGRELVEHCLGRLGGIGLVTRTEGQVLSERIDRLEKAVYAQAEQRGSNPGPADEATGDIWVTDARRLSLKIERGEMDVAFMRARPQEAEKRLHYLRQSAAFSSATNVGFSTGASGTGNSPPPHRRRGAPRPGRTWTP